MDYNLTSTFSGDLCVDVWQTYIATSKAWSNWIEICGRQRGINGMLVSSLVPTAALSN